MFPTSTRKKNKPLPQKNSTHALLGRCQSFSRRSGQTSATNSPPRKSLQPGKTKPILSAIPLPCGLNNVESACGLPILYTCMQNAKGSIWRSIAIDCLKPRKQEVPINSAMIIHMSSLAKKNTQKWHFLHSCFAPESCCPDSCLRKHPYTF